MEERDRHTSPSPLPRAVIHQGELDLIGRWVLASPDLETGGELFGLWAHDGTPVIQLVVGPGPRCVRMVAEFHQDAEHLERERDEIVARHGLELIGTWHSHHTLGLARPSGGDSQTTAGVFDRTTRRRFFLIVANISDRYGLPERNGDPWVRGFLYTQQRGTDHRQCYWRVLPGDSPLRTERGRGYGTDSRRAGTPTVQAVPTAPTGARISQLRPGSWVEAPEGVTLLARIKADLETVADVSMAPDGQGRLQMRLRRGRDAWTLSLGQYLSAERATGELRQEPRGFPIRLFGTLSDIVEQAKCWVSRSTMLTSDAWLNPYVAIASKTEREGADAEPTGSTDEGENSEENDRDAVRTEAVPASEEGSPDVEDETRGATEGASSCRAE